MLRIPGLQWQHLPYRFGKFFESSNDCCGFNNLLQQIAAELLLNNRIA